MALTQTPEAELGTVIPDFNLPGLDGKTYCTADFQNGQPIVVMFICNHCPYVKAIEDRLIDLGRELRERSIPVIAICSNEATKYVEDSFENLKKRAELKGYPFVYLHDDSQVVAKKFGAVCTPDFFIYDRQNKLAYRGRLDDNWKEPTQVSQRELFEAALKLSQGQKLSGIQTPSMGCSIKWKSDAED